MNKESLLLTLETGRATYWSRSRKKLWKKGEESGNFQRVLGLYKDCDGDTLLIKIEQIGEAACHTGHRSCFYSQADGKEWKVISKPVFDPKAVYKK
jgi:phosphoribosyl-AMP cyclohydrolase